MLFMTSASCVGFGHFSFVFLAEERKKHEGVEERNEERVNLLCHQVLKPKPLHAGCRRAIKPSNETSKPPGEEAHRALNHLLASSPRLLP